MSGMSSCNAASLPLCHRPAHSGRDVEQDHPERRVDCPKNQLQCISLLCSPPFEWHPMPYIAAYGLRPRKPITHVTTWYMLAQLA
jgi:hypothetical protein